MKLQISDMIRKILIWNRNSGPSGQYKNLYFDKLADYKLEAILIKSNCREYHLILQKWILLMIKRNHLNKYNKTIKNIFLICSQVSRKSVVAFEHILRVYCGINKHRFKQSLLVITIGKPKNIEIDSDGSSHAWVG